MKARPPVPQPVRERIDANLAGARSLPAVEAWPLLEEAHVLSQPWPGPHVRVHLAMLRLGWQTRDRREIVGQLVRVAVAGPASAVGRYPEGNTGRSDVPATRPMPVPEELRRLLDLRHG